MTLAFVDAHPDVAWTRGPRLVHGSVAGIDVTAQARWWGRQWNLTAASPSSLPEPLLLFVSARGMDHGFWRDLRVGDAEFDRRFFIFCDTPPLLPIVLGTATRRALATADSIVLYLRGSRVTTSGVAPATDPAALDHHLAIHRALVDDHRAFVADWKRRIDDAGGRADDGWPPTATLLRPSGALTVEITWTKPTTRDASDWDEAAQSLRTEVTAHDDRERRPWTLREVRATAPTHVLGGRPFVLAGTLPFALATLDAIVARSGIASIGVRENRITVALVGIATRRQIDAAVRIIQLVVEATVASSPYR